MVQIIILLAHVFMAPLVFSAEESAFSTLTAEQLEGYQFEQSDSKFRVTPLNVGQQAILDSQRRTVSDLMLRHLGVSRLKGKAADLGHFQALIQRKAIRLDDVTTWQALGVVFGDYIAEQHGLTWVVYEDELGVSKALRWQDTDNFVFPVTVFSKRIQFKETPAPLAIYADLLGVIKRFKALEARPQLP